MLEIIATQKGHTTAVLKGVRLHSQYDPKKEAKRFIDKTIKKGSPATIILLGAGLGYLIEAIRSRFSYCRVLPVFYSRELADRCTVKLPGYWHPESGQPLIEFLRTRVTELDVEGLQVVEWPASARAFPILSQKANLAVSQLLREHRGSLVTTLSLGKRWIWNSFKNFIFLGLTCQVNERAARKPILIAASGPTLEEAIEILHRHRHRIYLWALPSAACFLKGNGLDPDLIILTDPGYFALFHLHPLAGQEQTIAMPLSAATGTWRIPGRILLLSQNNFFEQALLDRARIQAPVVPPQGTVAATAVELALKLSRREIILAGFDLCYRDIQSHCRPNTFELFLLPGADRLHPFQGLIYGRAAETAPKIIARAPRIYRSGLVLETYAGWFSGLFPEMNKRLYRLNPTPVGLEGMTTMTNEELNRLLGQEKNHRKGEAFIIRDGYPQLRRRKQIALDLLSEWEGAVQKSIDSLKGGKGLRQFWSDRLQIGLAYYINPTSLLKIRKVLRLEGEGRAIDKVISFLQKERVFLRNLYRKSEYL